MKRRDNKCDTIAKTSLVNIRCRGGISYRVSPRTNRAAITSELRMNSHGFNLWWQASAKQIRNEFASENMEEARAKKCF